MVENHSGRNEKTEVFGGKRYKAVSHGLTKVEAERKVRKLHGEGKLARKEQEMRGKFNVYERGK